jgi:hypothetical protein
MRWKRFLSNRVSSAAQLCPLRKSLTLLVLMVLWCTYMTCGFFSSPRTALRVRHTTQQFRLWSTRSSNDIHSVAIIGGGLAGLSTAHHFIQKQPGIQITIFDKAPVGTAGASSVAGGYVPCSTLILFVHATLVALSRKNTHYICYSSWSHKLMTTIIISPRSLRLQTYSTTVLYTL